MQKYWWKANLQKDFHPQSFFVPVTNKLCWLSNYKFSLGLLCIWTIQLFWYQIFSCLTPLKYFVWNIYEIGAGDMTMTGWLLRAPHFSDPTDPVHIKQQGDHVVLKSLSTHVHLRFFLIVFLMLRCCLFVGSRDGLKINILPVCTFPQSGVY